MIEYIKGQLTELTPTYSVIECSGVGYLLNISVPTYSALEGKTDAKLLVHEAIREDAHVLYGFSNGPRAKFISKMLNGCFSLFSRASALRWR